jgi:hypothetical protein
MQEFAAGKFHFCTSLTSFDHLVGAGEQRQRQQDAQCLCSFAVYHLELSLAAAAHRATEFV